MLQNGKELKNDNYMNRKIVIILFLNIICLFDLFGQTDSLYNSNKLSEKELPYLSLFYKMNKTELTKKQKLEIDNFVSYYFNDTTKQKLFISSFFIKNELKDCQFKRIKNVITYLNSNSKLKDKPIHVKYIYHINANESRAIDNVIYYFPIIIRAVDNW
jgi:hypothetical protein